MRLKELVFIFVLFCLILSLWIILRLWLKELVFTFYFIHVIYTLMTTRRQVKRHHQLSCHNYMPKNKTQNSTLSWNKTQDTTNPSDTRQETRHHQLVTRDHSTLHSNIVTRNRTLVTRDHHSTLHSNIFDPWLFPNVYSLICKKRTTEQEQFSITQNKKKLSITLTLTTKTAATLTTRNRTTRNLTF